MIVLCYTIIDEEWDTQTFEEKLRWLPEEQRKRILAYKSIHDRQLRLQGKLLVGEVLNRLGLENYSAADIKYDAYNRPFIINNGVNFNVSHSGDVVLCAGIANGKIGVDIEHIKPIDVADVKDVFMEEEWNVIVDCDDPVMTAYRLWTRKEAILKAAGKGVLGEPSSINVVKDEVVYEHEMYSLYSSHIKDGYIISIAANRKGEKLQMHRID